MNDHELIENLEFLLNLEMVTDAKDLELIENLQEFQSAADSEKKLENGAERQIENGGDHE